MQAFRQKGKHWLCRPEGVSIHRGPVHVSGVVRREVVRTKHCNGALLGVPLPGILVGLCGHVHLVLPCRPLRPAYLMPVGRPFGVAR